jgi:hypothetical protein
MSRERQRYRVADIGRQTAPAPHVFLLLQQQSGSRLRPEVRKHKGNKE